MDNGSESAPHLLIDESTGMLAYYADPYSSYQRGSNENRNGMAQEGFDGITRRTDNAPLGVLVWLSPAEAGASR